MATAEATVPNGQTNGNAAELSAAQKLMQKHADETHKATVEEVIDEADLKHPEAPLSASILESKGEPDAPSWLASSSAKAAGKQKAEEKPLKENKSSLDTQSHELFPELGGAPKPQAAPKVAPIWSMKQPAGNGTNGKSNGTTPSNGTSRASTPASVPAPVMGQNGRVQPMSIPNRATERISLAPSQIMPRQQMKKPLQDVLKDINRRSKATITTTTGQGGVIYFNASGPQEACRQALQDVVKQVGSKQAISVPVPSSVRAHIIGKAGSTIKGLQEKTGAKIQMPRAEENQALATDDDDDASINVLIEGDALAAEMARREIEKIVNERTATTNQRMRDVPAEFYPFIAGAQSARVNALEEGKDLRIRVPSHYRWTSQPPPQQPAQGQAPVFLPAAEGNHITLTGERLAVLEARAEIERQVQELRRQLTLEQLAINKGQHQFIIGERGVPVQDFFEETGCAIILPSGDDDEMITIVGPPDQVQAGVEKVMELASSMQSTNLDISRQHQGAPGVAIAHARNLTRYLERRKEIERLEKLYSTHIVTPPQQDGPTSWELYSRDGKNVIRARSDITSIVNGHPPSRMSNVNVDPFFHRHLRTEAVPAVRNDYGVHMIVPEDSEDEVPVLLVFEGPSAVEGEYQMPRTRPSEADVKAFKKGLQDAENHIMQIINSQQAISSQTVEVPPK